MKISRGKIKTFLLIIMIFTIIYLLILLISYNIPNKVDSKLSGIFIDRDSAMRGVSVDRIHLDSIDEVNPNSNSTYWFGCSFNNYTPPVYLEVYFPFDMEIFSYGACRGAINIYDGTTSLGDEKCYSFDARVVDGQYCKLYIQILKLIMNNLSYQQIYLPQ